METKSDFILGGSKITADGDCSHEIKRRLLLGRKVITNLDSILKSRDITLPTKVCPVKAIVFPVVMYGCESWIIKKAEWQRIHLPKPPQKPTYTYYLFISIWLNIQKTKIMASGLITSCQIDGETLETVKDFIYLFIWLQNHCRL